MLCYAAPFVELLGLTTPVFKPGSRPPSFLARLWGTLSFHGLAKNVAKG